MSTAADIIQGALININAYNPADPLQPTDMQQGLAALNDLLDSLSNDHNVTFYSVENIIAWTVNQWQYTIGNPFIEGASTFSGTFTSGSNVITSIPSIPSTLQVGAWLTEVGGAIPSSSSATPVIVSAIGSNTVTFTGPRGAALNASATVTEQINYSTPGNIAYDAVTGAVINRPLKCQPGFTRITTGSASGLDYWYDVISIKRYKEYGWKGVPGPWPYVLAYNATYPYGTFNVYPNPMMAGQVHFWSDQILSTFADTTTDFQMPQGYSRALKKLLAIELAPIFGKQVHPALERQAVEALKLIKANNSEPVATLRYDSDLVRSQSHDAGWVVNGGFLP